MTFDDAYTNYKTKRHELRELQGDLDKLANERRELTKKIKATHRADKAKHREYVDAMGQLIPELNKEVTAHPMPADLSNEIADEESE